MHRTGAGFTANNPDKALLRLKREQVNETIGFYGYLPDEDPGACIGRRVARLNNQGKNISEKASNSYLDKFGLKFKAE